MNGRTDRDDIANPYRAPQSIDRAEPPVRRPAYRRDLLLFCGITTISMTLVGVFGPSGALTISRAIRGVFGILFGIGLIWTAYRHT